MMKHVLIVDDALDLGRLLQTALVMLDPSMPVVVVPSAEEAILEATRHRLDLLITDLNLPGISGIELVKRIRKYHPDVHVIVITGMTDDELLQQVKELQVDALLHKPMSIPDFIETANKSLEVKRISPTAERQNKPDTRQEEEAGRSHLADVLSNLRGQLSAQEVMLIDDFGKILANSGNVHQEIFEPAWISEVLNAASSASILSGYLGKPKPEMVSVLKGEKINLVFTPVGRYVLLIILAAKGSSLRLARAFEETISARSVLVDILQGMGINIDSVIPARPPVEEQAEELQQAVEEVEMVIQADLEDFEKLLSSGSTGIDLDELNSFWEDSVRVEDMGPANPDDLSFDEASQLGLTPDELK